MFESMTPIASTLCVITACVVALLTFASCDILPVHASLPVGIVSVDPTTNFFKEESGRVRIFRGTNIVWKGQGLYPNSLGTSVNSTVLEILRNVYGVSSVRLGFNWGTIEPHRGIYDNDAIKAFVEFGRNLTSVGIAYYL